MRAHRVSSAALYSYSGATTKGREYFHRFSERRGHTVLSPVCSSLRNLITPCKRRHSLLLTMTASTPARDSHAGRSVVGSLLQQK
jgi:hypothetical protein